MDLFSLNKEPFSGMLEGQQREYVRSDDCVDVFDLTILSTCH